MAAAYRVEYDEIDKIATKICLMVKTKDEKLERRWVEKAQMIVWYNGKNRNQVREVHLDEDHVANIIYKIQALGHADLANPILCYEDVIDKKKELVVIDGNNTNAALLRADKKGYISIDGSEVLVIPKEFVPKDKLGKQLLFDAIGAEMNVPTVLKKGMMPRDLRAMVKRHLQQNVDVDDKSYRKMLERKFQMTSNDVSSNVSKAKSEYERDVNNQLNNFHEYSKEDGHYIKKVRTKEFDKQNRSVGVCWAIVDRCKKLPETLGKAMGLAINNSEIHIVFNFSDFEDVSYQHQVEKYIARFSKKYNIKFSYEFLPWKQGEAEV
jgi:hypothetical protein